MSGLREEMVSAQRDLASRWVTHRRQYVAENRRRCDLLRFHNLACCNGAAESIEKDWQRFEAIDSFAYFFLRFWKK